MKLNEMCSAVSWLARRALTDNWASTRRPFQRPMLYPLLWGGHSCTVHRSTLFRICVFSPLPYFNWPHLPALHCTLNRDDEMISHQLPLLMSPRRSRPLLPMIMFQGQWHAPIEPLPKLPWQLFSDWAGYLTLSQWWCDKCHNYVNSVQSDCFFFQITHR